jgi:hypothetical protein
MLAAEVSTMKRQMNRESDLQISRRSLLKVGGAATLAVGALATSGAAAQDGGTATGLEGLDTLGGKRESYWKKDGDYFVQDNVELAKVEQGIVRARINGHWRDFVVRQIDDAFFDFNMAMRKRTLDLMAGTGQYEMYNDAHNAAVGTYGSNRGDSAFIVNVAFKGMGWVPRSDLLEARIQELQDNYKASMMKKMQILYAGYLDKQMWDRRIIGSLELYTTQAYETHSFLNQMVNPVSTLCTLAEESYEFRTVARLMHYNDPRLSTWEKNVVKYINFAHDFFHGGPDPNQLTVHNIGVMYLVVEEFDNSPWGATDTAGGKQRVPAP